MQSDPTKKENRIVLDVWGGESSMQHIARFLPKMADALVIAEQELSSGYLVNMRAEVAWGILIPFDSRMALEGVGGILQ